VSSSNRISRDVLATRGVWRQGVIRQAIDLETMGLGEAWSLAAMVSRQTVCTGFSSGDA